MSADTLRRAAGLMRERALGARAGRWATAKSTSSPDSTAIFAEWEDKRHVATCSGSFPEGNENNAAHIASWHPAVALAVADLLEHTAVADEKHREALGRGIASGRMDYALALATTYLGSES